MVSEHNEQVYRAARDRLQEMGEIRKERDLFRKEAERLKLEAQAERAAGFAEGKAVARAEVA